MGHRDPTKATPEKLPNMTKPKAVQSNSWKIMATVNGVRHSNSSRQVFIEVSELKRRKSCF